MNRYSALALALALAIPPALAQEREWSLDSSEDEAFMIFGVPESDDVGISFWCSLRSGEVRIFVPEASEKLGANKIVNFDVFVGNQSFGISGNTLPNEEAGTMSIEGIVPVAHPLFAALKSAGHFSVKVESDAQSFPLAGADIDTLLNACGKS
jgi:hypothetical protein